ncbi:MAG: hypothetical protein EPO08_03455 [Rhodospirillaceae bacterium]|nr:MAG: hypothetical protein EPO08_03455 [Rhodospirillaceae bacterium]
MSDGPPLAQQAMPIIERGEGPGAPISAETIQLLSGMAATILAGSVALARADLDAETAAALAVQMSVAVANEIREHRIIGGRIKRMERQCLT